MDISKEQMLNDSYAKLMEIILNSVDTDEALDIIVDKDLIAFGTTIDEKVFSLADFRKMLRTQKEQSKELEIHFKAVPLKHLTTATGNTAVFADEIIISIKVENETIEMYIRFSAVLEYRKNKWVLIHFHTSKPEYVESEKDTFGIEDWKQKNAELEKKIAEKTAELQQSLMNLKATQSQLIQSEKMASLGELTAGIAHEIQNPLNFVNNFSEVNNEMVDEAAEEINNGNYDEAKNILNDIKDNSQKINHHGKRADAIVKGMLQHSRKSEGVKEPTDINALCDEFLRLSYHGLRAKEKDFNADFKTDFDVNIGKINIVPQDIGRVLLNLVSNSFYATNERKKTADETYKPLVSIQTKKINDKIEIKVSDNGNGIPSTIKEKIFQPFFTTKPTGQGTGLGLSLSYDIIKAHTGTIKVETKQGEGTIFIIELPIA